MVLSTGQPSSYPVLSTGPAGACHSPRVVPLPVARRPAGAAAKSEPRQPGTDRHTSRTQPQLPDPPGTRGRAPGHACQSGRAVTAASAVPGLSCPARAIGNMNLLSVVPPDPCAGHALQVSDSAQLRDRKTGPSQVMAACRGQWPCLPPTRHRRLDRQPTQNTPDLRMNIHLPPRPSMRALSICTTSHGGSPRRPLTFREVRPLR